MAMTLITAQLDRIPSNSNCLRTKRGYIGRGQTLECTYILTRGGDLHRLYAYELDSPLQGTQSVSFVECLEPQRVPGPAVSHRAGRTVYAQRLRPAAATMTPPAVADLPHARARGGAGVGAPIELLGDLDVLEGPVGQPSAPVRVVQLAIEELRFRQRRALEARCARRSTSRRGHR